MAKLKVEQFVDLLKRSGLVDNERLNQALSGVDQSVNDSGIVAACLTKAGLLTEWQTEKLLQGRHKGFYLGKYKLLSHIGTGGMGAVYLAEHQVMRHRVAIKLLPNHLAAHASYLERFYQEARASAGLAHPNIIRAFDVDQQENIHYLVMEYVEGADLQAVVSRSGPLDYETAANYARQAAEGLAYAHRMGLIHRDVKPANLLVDNEGTVKILDMGLARFTDESQGSLTMAYDQKMIGTVDYLAPEQALDSHKVDARADIYSLGCTFYFMLTGDPPFPQGTIPQRLILHQSGEPADIRQTRSDAPFELIAICKKMMAKSVDDRYQAADEVASALADWLGDSGFKTGGSGVGTKGMAPPPSGPSLNEDLDLAPIEDETNGRGGSKAGAKPNKAEDSKIGQSASKSGVRQGSPPADKPASSPGKKPESSIGGAAKKPKSSITSGASNPQATSDLAKPEDLMDDLLSATALPRSEHLPTAPLGTHKSQHELNLASRMGIVVGVGIAGAVVLVGIVLVLIWLTTKL
jgi:serine/threonine-protein kinase